MPSSICVGHFTLERLGPHHAPTPPGPLVAATCHELAVISAEMAGTQHLFPCKV